MNQRELVELIKQQRLQTHQKWRVAHDSALAAHAALSETNDAQRQFIAAMRAKTLSPEEVVATQLQLFDATPGASVLAVQLHLRRSAIERIKLHNWRVLAVRGEPLLSQWGDKVEALRYPLLLAPELDDINELMYRELEAAQITGGAEAEWVPTQFRQRRRLDELTGGAYFAPLHHDGQGNSAIDMSEMDDKLRFLYERNERANAEMLRMLQQRQAGRGSQGRQGFRGKRGRGGWRPYGGGAVPAAAAEKSEAKPVFRHVEGTTSTVI